MAFNAPCTRERSASSNTMTLFTESELYNGTHPSDRASIAFEKMFQSVRPSRNFCELETATERDFFLKRPTPASFPFPRWDQNYGRRVRNFFFSPRDSCHPRREFYSNLCAKSLLFFPSRSERPCPPFLFFSRATPSRSSGSFERRDKVTSSNYER